MKIIYLAAFFTICILYTSCKKEDYREEITGSYYGELKSVTNGATPSYSNVTIGVKINKENDNTIIITGDIASLSNPNGNSRREEVLNSDYTFHNGKFINDSLYFLSTDYHNITIGYYKLKKQ